MNAIRRLIFGTLAVAMPAGAVFILMNYTWCTSGFECIIPYGMVLMLTLGVVALFARLSIRFGCLSPALTVFLTTLPFNALTMLMVPTSMAARNVLPLLFWAVQLASAIYVAHAATRDVRHAPESK